MAYTEHAPKSYVDSKLALKADVVALQAVSAIATALDTRLSQLARDTYTKTQIDYLTEAIKKGRFKKVDSLPEIEEAELYVIYLVPRSDPESQNVKDEYIVIVGDGDARSWEKVGSTDVDLSGYATKEEVKGVRDSVNSLASDVDALQDDITSDSSRISTMENKVDNPSSVPTEDSNDLISSGGVFAALAGKADKETDERFMRAKADVYLSARKGNDANDGLAPERAVKTIGRAYAAAKAAVDAQTLDGTKQVVVAVDEGVYGSVELNCELTAGIAFRAVGARESTFVVPSDDPDDMTNQTPMSCDNGTYPRVFEMEGFTFTGFNGRHIKQKGGYQRGIVYGMTLRRCLITGNRPICSTAFVCGTFIDCDITGNAPRIIGNTDAHAVFGGYAAVYSDLGYMTRIFNCHVWDNDFSVFQYFSEKVEAANCLFENQFAVIRGQRISDSYGSRNNTMIAERYTNPNFSDSSYGDTWKQFHNLGSNYFAVIASSADSTTDPFYVETDGYVCVQSADLTEDKVAADASCPSVRSDGSLDFGYRDSGFGRKKTADSKQSALMAQQLANIAAVSDAPAFDATHTYEAGDPVVYDGTLYTFTSAHTGAWTGSDVSAVNIIASLNGKLDKSGGTFGATTISLTDEGIAVSDTQSSNLTLLSSSGNFLAHRDGLGVRYFAAPSTSGTLALIADLPYDLVTKTVTNGAVTLDDRASNSVTISATLSPNTLTINFPTATSGKARDFAMRLNIAAGVTAPEIAWPKGVTLENDGGEVPEIADGGTGGSSTILYFSETENNGTTAKFLVKSETLTAITQA